MCTDIDFNEWLNNEFIYIYIYIYTHTLACNLCSTHDLLNVINIIFLLKKKRWSALN